MYEEIKEMQVVINEEMEEIKGEEQQRPVPVAPPR
jgi:hypothetical protein